jgi:hypothetical protein
MKTDSMAYFRVRDKVKRYVSFVSWVSEQLRTIGAGLLALRHLDVNAIVSQLERLKSECDAFIRQWSEWQRKQRSAFFLALLGLICARRAESLFISFVTVPCCYAILGDLEERHGLYSKGFWREAVVTTFALATKAR